MYISVDSSAEFVIHQGVIIRLLTTSRPERRTGEEPGDGAGETGPVTGPGHQVSPGPPHHPPGQHHGGHRLALVGQEVGLSDCSKLVFCQK